VWLVTAATGEVCLVRSMSPLGASSQAGTAVGHSCVPEAVAQNGGLHETQSLTTSVTGIGKEQIIGAVPNGVRSVTILSGRGLRTPAPVYRNAYEVVVSDPRAVMYTTRAGRHLVKHTVQLFAIRARATPQPTDAG
jgi:hypothetical protein